MDGNGRWARQRGLPRLKGHEEGAKSVKAVVSACRDAGVKYVTLYAFSTENWVRPASEVNGLMNLLVKFLRNEEHELHDYHTRLRVMGRIEDLPGKVRKELARVMEATKRYRKRQLVLALSYGSRAEITQAARNLARRVKDGELNPNRIDEKIFAKELYLPEIPDPDLLIRTSGELRLSNFMLWQLSYAEFYFSDALWPEFRKPELEEALKEYGRRKRRFGDTGA